MAILSNGTTVPCEGHRFFAYQQNVDDIKPKIKISRLQDYVRCIPDTVMMIRPSLPLWIGTFNQAQFGTWDFD